jgi:glutamyl/glutaminyl-tRNA synthetase
VSARFAPTTSGPAHPGTLVAGLLAWLDARSRGAPILLRLEDVDSTRCTPESADDMRAALAWFGFDWDREELQSGNRPVHEAALDALAAQGWLYPCTCSRSEIASAGVRAPDGGWRYTGRCREKSLPAGGWRAADAALRVRLPEERVDVSDESGLDL